MMKKPLVILSGGQDSTYCLFWAKKRADEVHALTFEYGQRHRAEVEAAKVVARMAGVASHSVLGLHAVFGGTSPLVSAEPLAQYETVEEMQKKVGGDIEATFVPGRNMVFLALAASYAETHGLDGLIIGVSQEDYANYPDCREMFLLATSAAINLGMGHQLPLVAPLLHKTKAESILEMHDNPEAWAALAYTHTAYDGHYPPTGHDHASMLRARAFLDADLPDPLVLRAHSEGLMPLPDSKNYVKA
jgi:7-cyano-7-deazaguanine synthase